MQTYDKVGTMPLIKRLVVVNWLIVSAVIANMVVLLPVLARRRVKIVLKVENWSLMLH